MVFHAPQDRWYHAPPSEGGVGHDSGSRYGEAASLYMPDSAVVINFESARPRRTGKKAVTRGAPPQNGGGMRPRKEVRCGTPLSGLMTDRSRPHLSLREGLEQPPFPLALHCVGSVLAVKGPLRRFAPWTAPGRSERRAAHEGKGGGGPWGARASR